MTTATAEATPRGPVIDVDSHFMEPFAWLKGTDSDLSTELDESLPPHSFAEVVFGEVIADLPPEQQAEFMDILPGRFRTRMAEPEGGPVDAEEADRRAADSPMAAFLKPKGGADADERLELMDEHGIDVQFLNPTLALGHLQRVRRHRPDLLGRFCRAYNTWAAGVVDGHAERLIPVSIADLSEPATAVEELTRMRAAGSRGFLVPLYPVQGRSLAHVDFEPVWAAAVDLGMFPIMHVASGSVVFDSAWTNTGRPDRAKNAFRLASSQNAQIPQVPLAALVHNGVFDRHPDLVVLCSEFGLSWVPGWLDKLGPASRHGAPNIGSLVGWDLPLSAEEYLTRNVRFSPLKGQRVDELIAELGPTSVLFASDYPHPEGSVDAVAEFADQLDGTVDEEAQRGFFGGTMAELLARS